MELIHTGAMRRGPGFTGPAAARFWWSVVFLAQPRSGRDAPEVAQQVVAWSVGLLHGICVPSFGKG